MRGEVVNVRPKKKKRTIIDDAAQVIDTMYFVGRLLFSAE